MQRRGQSSLFGFGSCDARSGEGIRALEDLIQVLFELVENRVACLSGDGLDLLEHDLSVDFGHGTGQIEVRLACGVDGLRFLRLACDGTTGERCALRRGLLADRGDQGEK